MFLRAQIVGAPESGVDRDRLASFPEGSVTSSPDRDAKSGMDPVPPYTVPAWAARADPGPGPRVPRRSRPAACG